jgi:hypothetical protein
MPQRQCLCAISRRDELGLRFSYREASALSDFLVMLAAWEPGKFVSTVSLAQGGMA